MEKFFFLTLITYNVFEYFTIAIHAAIDRDANYHNFVQMVHTDWSYFLSDFCGCPRNGSLYRAFTGVFVTFRTHDVALSFDTSTVTRCSREFSLVLQRYPKVSQGVRLIFCHFAVSRSLDVEPDSKARDESGSTARHCIRLNYGPAAVSFIPESIIPLKQRGATFRRNL